MERSSEDIDQNERLFRLGGGWMETKPFDWIRGLDRTAPANLAMMEAIENAKAYFGLEANQQREVAVEREGALLILDPVVAALEQAELNEDLRTYGEGVIGQACEAMISAKCLAVQERARTSRLPS